MSRGFVLEDNSKSISQLPKSTTKFMAKKWLFRVRVTNLKKNEIVCVSGNVPELGYWQLEKCIFLEQENDKDIWSKTVIVPNTVIVRYRYCVCVIIKNSSYYPIVRSWETHLNPREIRPAVKSPSRKDEPSNYGEYENIKKIDRGWLTKETVIQLKFFNNPLTLWQTKYCNRKLSIKVSIVGLLGRSNNSQETMREDSEECFGAQSPNSFENPKYSFIEVASLNNKDSSFHLQPHFGEDYKENDTLIFQCTVLYLENIVFLIDLYVYSSRSDVDEPPHHFGFSYLLSSVLQSSEGNVVLPVTSTKHRPLGQVRVGYVVIKPMTNFKCDMSVSYVRYWGKARTGLDVGHRGSGSTLKMQNCPEIRENTVASFKNAFNHGADYVEFDVQLSKDLIPILYHDFHVGILMKRKVDTEEDDMLELPVKELTSNQLKLLKLYPVTRGSKTIRFLDEESEDNQPFPTLQHILETLNPHLGFNIEIKWTMQLADGSFELYHPTDINLYLDKILDVVLRHGESRRIVFSCFNPDVCAVIKLKQNKYPVMFLTESESFKQYADPRCWSIPNAVQYATMIEILGLCVHTEDLIREPILVQLVQNKNLIIFCWGDQNANPVTIKYMKELGLHGIIFDKIHQNSCKEVKECIFYLEARDSEKNLIQKTAVDSVAEFLSSPPISIITNQFMDVEKARQNVEQNLSTATSFESLTSH